MFSYELPIYVEFGEGVASRIGAISKSEKHKKLLLITDAGVIKAKLLESIINSLEENCLEFVVFDKVEPNPKDMTVALALELLHREGCDSVAAVGGGSSMDVGKVVSMMATNGGHLCNYEFHVDTSLDHERIKRQPLPLFTIPTTAGTGSEVDFWAVITDTSRKVKMLLGQGPLHPNGPYMGAKVALVDPTMTITLPQRQTAATGFDAFIHGVEFYTSTGASPMFQPLALGAAELAAKWLPIAYADGYNIEARARMMLAAHMAGVCLNYGGLGLIHALAEAIGGLYQAVPHGCALAVVAPAVMSFNSHAVSQQYLELGRKISHESSNPSAETSVDLVETVRNLIGTLHLPQRLRSLDIRADGLQDIATKASQAIEITSNPRQASKTELLEILEESY